MREESEICVGTTQIQMYTRAYQLNNMCYLNHIFLKMAGLDVDVIQRRGLHRNVHVLKPNIRYM